ncbi:MAG: hypothetical protein D6813_11730, partial [Calditrichaeota bacterium]
AWAALDQLNLHIPLFLLSYAVVFVIYFYLIEFVLHHQREIVEDSSKSFKTWQGWLSQFTQNFKKKEIITSKQLLLVGIVFGLLFRVTLLFMQPSLSNDIYRYMWDGKVAAHNINPYLYPPNAPELSDLRDAKIFPQINHKEIPTIYPPVSQFLFYTLAKITSTVTVYKIAFISLDLLTAIVLFLILKNLKLNLSLLLIYLWNPLLLLEVAGNGHFDTWGIFFLTLVLWFIIKQKWLFSILFLSFSFLTKYVTGIFLPVIAWLKKENGLVIILSFIAIVATLFLPYASAGNRLFTGLLIYFDKWRFNDSIFALILTGVVKILPNTLVTKWMIEPYNMTPDIQTLMTRKLDLALIITKGFIAIIFLILLMVILKKINSQRTNNSRDIFKYGAILLAGLFLLSPTVHPWYLCWLLPFLTISPQRSWILWTGLVVLSYWVLIDFVQAGLWHETNWVKWIEYLPVFSVFVFETFGKRNF